MCSVFKWLAAAAVLKRVDEGRADLQQRIRFGRDVLLPTSPVTEQHVGGDGMTLADLCEAAVTQSDNAAANLLLKRLGGPAAVTRFVRTLGDDKTRLDRYEMHLNEARPGDLRDTTTPRAMTVSLQSALLGNGLSAAGRHQLQQWMLANRTGGERLRAGVPADWRVADRTGTGSRGTSNVVGVLWPPGRAPLVVAALLTGSPGDGARRNAALADVGRQLVRP
jgi:beta-lactamase class A